MALTEDANGIENVRLESPSGHLRDRANPLTYFWSVTLPHWLDPWAPRLADAFADGAWTAMWRGVSAFAPLLGLITGLLVPQVWPGMHTVYTESLLFMGLIIGGAILSGPVGVMMLLGYIMATLVWDSAGVPPRARNQEWLDYFVRRQGSELISYLLLAIPAVMVPQQARWMAEATPLGAKLTGESGVGVQVTLFAVGCGLLIYLWSHAMPALIRPVFTWLRMEPRVEAILPVQQGWHWLVGAAVIAAIVRLLAERTVIRDGSGAPPIAALQEQRWSQPERRGEFWRNVPVLVRIITSSAVVALILSGFYQDWLDPLVIVALTVFLEAWRIGLITRFPEWWEKALFKVPALLRFVTALFLGFWLSQWIITRPWRGDTFRPVLWAAVSTLLIFYFTFPHRTVSEEAAGERKGTE